MLDLLTVSGKSSISVHLFLWLAKSLSGEESAREIMINVLARENGVGTELPVATIRDRASV